MEQQEMILTKSYELFKRYGIRSVTMDEIAVQCGVSKKTVYQYFQDKESLIDQIVALQMNWAEKNCVVSQAESENAIHEVFLSLDWVHQMFDGVNPAMLFDLRKYHHKAYNRIEEHKREFLSAIVHQNLERGIQEGHYRENLRADIVVPLRIHHMTLVFDFDFLPKNKYTLNEIGEEITLMELYGMATAKGIKMIDRYRQQRLKQ